MGILVNSSRFRTECPQIRLVCTLLRRQVATACSLFHRDATHQENSVSGHTKLTIVKSNIKYGGGPVRLGCKNTGKSVISPNVQFSRARPAPHLLHTCNFPHPLRTPPHYRKSIHGRVCQGSPDEDDQARRSSSGSRWWHQACRRRGIRRYCQWQWQQCQW